MSSSSVCQGLQSCSEPRVMEPSVLSRKSTPPNSNFSRSTSPSSSQSHTKENNTTVIKTNNRNNDCDMKSEKTEDKSGWSFLQCLTNTSSQSNSKETAADNEKVYVDPLVKRSSSLLSQKSLEMCTESLGSETGSLVSENSDATVVTPISSPEITTTVVTPISSPQTTTGINYTPTRLRETNLVAKRTTRSVSFPPPLTSISGSSGVQVRPHREGGRLVLQAVTVSSSPTYFHAERSDGRLRLCLVKQLDRSPNEEDQEDEEEDEFEEEVQEEVEEDEDEFICYEIGIEKFPRSGRCKEGGRRVINKLNYEPFCVAT